ncbi:hypothetical protein BCR34DRAFT_613592 [Clohesyomyces aquaticus]|uniref:NACHT domain-containing protein n=1 Tax=Clohesyomyces aquaticus TaxID=1231657 RepID=A0A1Y1ZTB1_9PLEO|nr:hypothetical protein BCR34DRAFT_613592 [Clohesyomyces aquaticus]
MWLNATLAEPPEASGYGPQLMLAALSYHQPSSDPIMDPITAVSLAGNIVQFIDFAYKLITGAKNIAQSAAGRSTEHEEVDIIAESVLELNQNMACLSSAYRNVKSLSGREKTLLDLRQGCVKIGNELKKNLDDLQVSGSHKRWKSVGAALLWIMKDSKIKDLEKRLLGLQRQIDSHLIAGIQKQQTEVLSLLKKQAALSARTQLQSTQELNLVIESISKTFYQLRPPPGSTAASSVPRRMDREGIDRSRRALSKLANSIERARVISAQRALLISLDYDVRAARQDSVKPAHANTFKWILQDKTSDGIPVSFMKWLREDSGVYWISGKPGCGKSTLMKYISNHPNIQDAIKTWGNGGVVTPASYFFWNSGTPMQRSLGGLLRSVLIQVLDKCPELISKVFESRWSNMQSWHFTALQSPYWGIPELMEALRKVADEASLSSKFCFFIDGLDEYEGSDLEMVQIINDFNTSSYLKFCVSSRPHVAFQKAYGHDNTRMLDVAALTRPDIKLYVGDRLEKNSKFQEFQKKYYDRCQRLVNQIVQDANGVFLWVFLVTSRLLEGIETNDDRMSDLEGKLKITPKELNDLFRHILDSVKEDYHEPQAHMCRVASQADEALDLMMYHHMDMEDPDFAFHMTTKPVDISEQKEIRKVMQTRVAVRCKGLLEVVEDDASLRFRVPRVQLLHRTFRDFILDKDMQRLLKARSATKFDPLRAICLGHLAGMKAVRVEFDPKTGYYPFLLLLSLMHYAMEAELTQDVSYGDILNEAKNVLLQLPRPQKSLLHPIRARMQYVIDNLDDGSFTELAAKSGLALYTAACLVDQPLSRVRMNAILRSVFWGLRISDIDGDAPEPLGVESFGAVLNPAVVELLLKHGADPNSCWSNLRITSSRGVSPALKGFLTRAEESDFAKAVFFNVRTLLQHGAEPPNEEAFTHLISKCDASDIHELERLWHSNRRTKRKIGWLPSVFQGMLS